MFLQYGLLHQNVPANQPGKMGMRVLSNINLKNGEGHSFRGKCVVAHKCARTKCVMAHFSTEAIEEKGIAGLVRFAI